MAFDSSTESTLRLIEMAGSQRLPADIRRLEIHDESRILHTMEVAVQAYIKTIPLKELHDKKKSQEVYKEVITILNKFEFITKDAFQSAWTILLCQDVHSESDPKQILEVFASIACNRILKNYITSQIRTPSKYKEILKRVLSEPMFEEIGLTSIELEQKAHQIGADTKLCATLDSMIHSEMFTGDPDKIVQQFYQVIRGVQNEMYRSNYYNQFLKKLITNMKSSMTTDKTTIFVQVYCFLVTQEIIKTVDPDVRAYLALHPIDFFLHQVRYMPLKLQPNSNFKQKGFILDLWQEDCIRAINTRTSILLSAPTSAGKTILSTHAIRNYNKVWYIVPSEALGYQLAGIILASLTELEERKGAVVKNVRLELASTSYRRFIHKNSTDNILIATPQEMVRFWKAKKIDLPEYIILDEFHNVSCKDGIYYEYLLKLAGYHKIPLMALSATIPNFEMVHTWLSSLLPGELFAVNIQKRFFNQKRFTFCHGTLVPIQPLKIVTMTQVRSPTFKKIGLYPQDVLSLYEALPEFPRIDGTIPRLVSLHEIEQLELDLFAYLKKQDNATLERILPNKPIESNNPTLWQLYSFLRTTNMTPMIIFKMNSFPCMNLFTKIIKMVQMYNKLVYEGLNGDKSIIRAYLEEAESIVDPDNLKVPKGMDEDKLEQMKNKLKENLFDSKYKPRLFAVYKEFLESTPKDYTEFNHLYGADLTYEKVLKMRESIVRTETRVEYNTISVRSGYTIHPDAMIAKTDGSIMRDIRKKINNELQYQYTHSGPFDYKYEEFKIEGNHISYEHPILVGIECGLLFYNQLMNPALTRICQQLINKYPFVILSDHSLAVGINYPIKTVLLQGGLKGEPMEEIDNTLAHQASGRGGRRGLDAEGIVIYSGVNITKILIPDYHPVCRNPIELMHPLLTDESISFQTFVQTEVHEKVAPVQSSVSVSNSATNSATNSISNSASNSACNLPINVEEYESWEDLADALGV